MATFIALHLLTVMSVAINFFLSESQVLAGTEVGGVYVTRDHTEEVIRNLTWGCIGGWALIGVVWTPINTWGLLTQKRWARMSTLLYWIGSMITLCCMPFAIYGIYSLLRPDVKAIFEEPRPG
jgi:hypothetical protein